LSITLRRADHGNNVLALKVKSTFVKALKENHFPERLSATTFIVFYQFYRQVIAQKIGLISIVYKGFTFIRQYPLL
jgi:hypothetical protein